jgi:hypothetical protein
MASTAEQLVFADFDFDHRTDALPISPLAKTWPTLPSFMIATGRVHVRFDDLPQPDKASGHINRPENGVIAKRRVQAQDDRRDYYTSRCFVNWQIDNPEENVPSWADVRWVDSPHPGYRVITLAAEGDLSPKMKPGTVADTQPRLAATTTRPWRRKIKKRLVRRHKDTRRESSDDKGRNVCGCTLQ